MNASTWSQDTYIKAYKFAAYAHLGQTVPGTEISYLMHVSLVAMEVIAALNSESGLDGDLAVQCALLHDVVEDTPITYDDIAREFGEAVAEGVRALTKDRALPKELRMPDSIRRIKQQPREIWMVKLADRITNLQPPPANWTPEKTEKYREEASLVHDELGSASAFLSARLIAKIAAYPENAVDM